MELKWGLKANHLLAFASFKFKIYFSLRHRAYYIRTAYFCVNTADWRRGVDYLAHLHTYLKKLLLYRSAVTMLYRICSWQLAELRLNH